MRLATSGKPLRERPRRRPRGRSRARVVSGCCLALPAGRWRGPGLRRSSRGGGSGDFQFPHSRCRTARPIGERDVAGRDAAIDETACRVGTLPYGFQCNGTAAARCGGDDWQRQHAGSLGRRGLRQRSESAEEHLDCTTWHGATSRRWRFMLASAGLCVRPISRACAQFFFRAPRRVRLRPGRRSNRSARGSTGSLRKTARPVGAVRPCALQPY